MLCKEVIKSARRAIENDHSLTIPAALVAAKGGTRVARSTNYVNQALGLGGGARTASTFTGDARARIAVLKAAAELASDKNA